MMEDINKILDESIKRGIISEDQRNKIIAVNEENLIPGAEKKKGLNYIRAFYYFGALIIIFAFTYFLASQWNNLPTEAVLIVALIAQFVCFGMGLYLRKKLNYNVSGGLLVSVAIAMTPLVIYCLEKMSGIWPAQINGGAFNYNNYWSLIQPCWVYIEIATLVVAALVLYWVRFAFIALIIGHTAWFLSMDLSSLMLGGQAYGELYWESRKWISILISVAMIAVAKLLNRKTKEDYSMWLFLYGGVIFTSVTAFSWLNNEASALLYLVIHVVFVVASIMWQRKSLMVFGAIGIYVYLAHLAYNVFKDSPLFPIALALVGLLMILGTVSFQKNKENILAALKV